MQRVERRGKARRARRAEQGCRPRGMQHMGARLMKAIQQAIRQLERAQRA